MSRIVKLAGPDPVDIHVGAQIRYRRIMLGLSQEAVAEKLGLTFQQLQKYEHGTNRVSASKLHKLAEILHCEVGDFFPPKEGAEASGPTNLSQFRATRAGADLMEASSHLRTDQLRAVLSVVKAISAASTIDHASSQAAE